MDEQEQINQIKLTHRRPHTWSDYFDYCQAYSLVVLFLFVGLACLYEHYNNFDPENIEDLLFWGCVNCGLSIILGYFTVTRLKDNLTFTPIKNEKGLSVQDFEAALAEYFTIIQSERDEQLDKYSYVTNQSWSSWGEEITVIVDCDIFLVNSQSLGRKAFSFYKDRNNIKAIKTLLTINWNLQSEKSTEKN